MNKMHVILLLIFTNLILAALLYYSSTYYQGALDPNPSTQSNESIAEKVQNGGKPEALDDVFSNENFQFSNYYHIFENQNIFDALYAHYKNNISTGDINDFINFKDNEGGSVFLSIAFAKMGKQDMWENYYTYLIDYYSQKGDNIIADVTGEYNQDEMARKDFLEALNDYFLFNENIVASNENIENDMNIIYGSNPIEDLVVFCGKHYLDKESRNSCIDNVYFAKSIDGKSCNKISDPFKEQLCIDFFESFVTHTYNP